MQEELNTQLSSEEANAQQGSSSGMAPPTPEASVVEPRLEVSIDSATTAGLVDVDAASVNAVTSAPGDRETISETAKYARKTHKSLERKLEEIERLLADIYKRRQQIDDLYTKNLALSEEAAAKVREALGVASDAAAARTKIEDSQKVIATKSEHIQNAQDHADKVRAELDRQISAAKTETAEVESIAERARAAVEEATAKRDEAKLARLRVDAEFTAAEAARKSAEQAMTQAKSLATRADNVERTLAKYETSIAELEQKCATQLKKIESLLPGATSAGLAQAFAERQKTFKEPSTSWQRIFFWSIVALVIVAGTGLLQVYHMTSAPTYDEVLRLWLSRLPIAGALVWLAIHASRESALAKRLEEDYGYKAAIAASFEGFQNQMAEIDVDVESGTPRARLCADTLSTIATPPGRIYEKHRLVITPSTEIAQAAKGVADAANSIKSLRGGPGSL